MNEEELQEQLDAAIALLLRYKSELTEEQIQSIETLERALT